MWLVGSTTVGLGSGRYVRCSGMVMSGGLERGWNSAPCSCGGEDGVSTIMSYSVSFLSFFPFLLVPYGPQLHV